jgi:hypothetical protein
MPAKMSILLNFTGENQRQSRSGNLRDDEMIAVAASLSVQG